MVFLDANILIELIVPGRAQYEQVKKSLSSYTEVYMSTLSTHLCWHFGRLAGVSDDLIAVIIGSCALLSLEPADYYWARENEQGRDFEDALQLACSLRNNCEQFMTLDKDLMKNYKGLTEFVTI
jgi:predicted nucleic acid-binding protein